MGMEPLPMVGICGQRARRGDGGALASVRRGLGRCQQKRSHGRAVHKGKAESAGNARVGAGWGGGGAAGQAAYLRAPPRSWGRSWWASGCCPCPCRWWACRTWGCRQQWGVGRASAGERAQFRRGRRGAASKLGGEAVKGHTLCRSTRLGTAEQDYSLGDGDVGLLELGHLWRGGGRVRREGVGGRVCCWQNRRGRGTGRRAKPWSDWAPCAQSWWPACRSGSALAAPTTHLDLGDGALADGGHL